MVQLTKYELGKIIGKKMVWFMLLFLAFFQLLGYFKMGAASEKVITTEGEMLEGKEAIRYMQEFDRRYKGELTDEKIAEIHDQVYTKEVAEKAGNYFFSLCPDIIQYADGRFYSGKGTKTTDVFTPEMGKIQLGYHRGHSILLFQGINMMLVAGCVIVTAIAPVFSEEHARGTDALLLTARYGKTLLVRAKIAAAFLFGILICMSVVGVNGILYLSAYGTEGWDTSVQVDLTGRNWTIPYEMNYGEMLGYAVLIWLVACLLLTGMTLLISACCRTSFAAVVLAAACFVVPVWFSLPKWLQAISDESAGGAASCLGIGAGAENNAVVDSYRHIPNGHHSFRHRCQKEICRMAGWVNPAINYSVRWIPLLGRTLRTYPDGS